MIVKKPILWGDTAKPEPAQLYFPRIERDTLVSVVHELTTRVKASGSSTDCCVTCAS